MIQITNLVPKALRVLVVIAFLALLTHLLFSPTAYPESKNRMFMERNIFLQNSNLHLRYLNPLLPLSTSPSLDELFPHLIHEPDVPIADCLKKELIAFPCGGYDAFTDNKLPVPRKVALLIYFDYNVDALEILLNELYDVIDVFFIMESTRDFYNTTAKKPLFFEHVRLQKRFLFFYDKIVHVVSDDTDLVGNDGVESVIRTKFDAWNKGDRLIGKDDLVAVASGEQIVSRFNVAMMKNCDAVSGIQIAMWMPLHGFNDAVVSPDPLGHELGFKGPCFRSSKHDFCDRHLVGGIDLSQVNKHVKSLLPSKEYKSVTIKHGSEFIPWFYTCNTRRYEWDL